MKGESGNEEILRVVMLFFNFFSLLQIFFDFGRLRAVGKQRAELEKECGCLNNIIEKIKLGESCS